MGGSQSKNGEDLQLGSILDRIKNNGIKNIIVMCGAGISTSAGIPDFRLLVFFL